MVAGDARNQFCGQRGQTGEWPEEQYDLPNQVVRIQLDARGLL